MPSIGIRTFPSFSEESVKVCCSLKNKFFGNEQNFEEKKGKKFFFQNFQNFLTFCSEKIFEQGFFYSIGKHLNHRFRWFT